MIASYTIACANTGETLIVIVRLLRMVLLAMPRSSNTTVIRA
jgi:hypothetical protein